MSQGLIEAIRHGGSDGGDGGDAHARAVTRRHFLKLGVGIGAAAGGGLLLGFSLSARSQDQGPSSTPSVIGGDAQITQQPGEFAPNAFVRIERSGLVTLVMPKVEMGQGVYTSIPMLLAEELEVPLSQVKLDHAPPDAALYKDPLLGGQLTGGSTSTRYAWEPMRRAGAVGRVLLIGAAAQQWAVDPASCHADNGTVIHQASGRTIAYGELVDAAAKLPVPPDLFKSVALKQPADFKLIGKRIKRLDSPEKVNGVAQFGLDVRLPGMLYAVVANSPVVGG
jgi:isoquinoline 1-oxidoreductase beta subunit